MKNLRDSKILYLQLKVSDGLKKDIQEHCEKYKKEYEEMIAGKAVVFKTPESFKNTILRNFIRSLEYMHDECKLHMWHWRKTFDLPANNAFVDFEIKRINRFFKRLDKLVKSNADTNELLILPIKSFIDGLYGLSDEERTKRNAETNRIAKEVIAKIIAEERAKENK